MQYNITLTPVGTFICIWMCTVSVMNQGSFWLSEIKEVECWSEESISWRDNSAKNSRLCLRKKWFRGALEKSYAISPVLSIGHLIIPCQQFWEKKIEHCQKSSKVYFPFTPIFFTLTLDVLSSFYLWSICYGQALKKVQLYKCLGFENDSVEDLKEMTAISCRKRGKRRYFWEYSEQLTPSQQERMLRPSEWNRETLPSNMYQKNGLHHGESYCLRGHGTLLKSLSDFPVSFK